MNLIGITHSFVYLSYLIFSLFENGEGQMGFEDENICIIASLFPFFLASKS